MICLYSHVTFAKENDDKTKDLIKKLKKKIDNFEKKFEEMQTILTEKDSKINYLKLKFSGLETKVKNFEIFIFIIFIQGRY